MEGLLIIPGGIIIGLALRHFLTNKIKGSVERANKMARLISEKQYDKALKISDSIPLEKQTWIERTNFTAALYFNGKEKEAKDLISSVSTRNIFQLPVMGSQGKKLVNDWKEKLLV